MTKPRRGRGGDPQLTVIYWRDIPAQVKAQAGRERASAKLPDRFMASVDAAATKSGLTSEEDYIVEWREEVRECGSDLHAEVDREVTRIADSYPSDLVKIYVRNDGWAAGAAAGAAANAAATESP